MRSDEGSDDENFYQYTGEEREILRNVTVVYVKSQVRVIRDWDFNGCTHLSRVSFNRRLKVIGEKAFARCRSLRFIYLPCAVRAINDGAFEDCLGLLTGLLRADGYFSWETLPT